MHTFHTRTARVSARVASSCSDHDPAICVFSGCSRTIARLLKPVVFCETRLPQCLNLSFWFPDHLSWPWQYCLCRRELAWRCFATGTLWMVAQLSLKPSTGLSNGQVKSVIASIHVCRRFCQIPAYLLTCKYSGLLHVPFCAWYTFSTYLSATSPFVIL